jgi:hypothetical protein
MTGHARTPSRIPIGVWALASAALHAMLVVASPFRQPHALASARAPSVWMESLPPEPEPPPPAAPEPPVQPPPQKPRRVAPAPAPAKVAKTVTTEAAAPSPPVEDDAALGLPTGEGTLAIGREGTGAGTGEGSGRGGGTGHGTGEATAEPERKQGPAQLSLWIDPSAFVRMGLMRPAIALLMSVPGYRDTLRGSGIQPFSDLQRLRIRMAGLAPERLAVAGVHTGGEPALVGVAERVAAMRNRQPVWRGDADLRATSWVDGSGVDRGLAVHGGAFVIAERSAMPAMLGAGGPADGVASLSRMREHVVVLLTIEDAARYLPVVQPCALQSLRVSVAESGGRYRMTVNAHYRAASVADRAPSCLRALGAGAAEISNLVDWLARARSAPGSFSASLQLEVTNDDVEELLDQLAWALRSA